MNNFTREELMELLWAVDYVRQTTTNRDETMRRLQGRLLTMVDNYSWLCKDAVEAYKCTKRHKTEVWVINEEGKLVRRDS